MKQQELKNIGLDHLLGLDGNIEVQNEEGYWVKMEVSRVKVTAERPHGIKDPSRARQYTADSL